MGNNSKPQFIMLVGAPSTGKSTYVNALQEYYANGYIVISSDNELEAIAKTLGLTYSDVFRDYIKTATEVSNKKFREALANNHDIVLDKTSLFVGGRRGILATIPNHYSKWAVAFPVDTPEKRKIVFERLEIRAKETGKFIPTIVVESMMNNYQEPTLKEGFDGIVIIDINTGNSI